MDKFFILTKVFFLSSFNVNKRKNSQKPVFKTLGLYALMFLGLSIMYNFMLFQTYSFQGLDYRGLLVLILSISAFFVFISSFSQMQNVLFSSKDFEFVQSLPVKNSTVVAAKIATILLIGIIEDLIIYLPTIVLYIMFTGEMFGAAISIIAVLFVSFVPVLVSSIFGTLVALISKKLKNKTVFQIIVYLLYFFVVFLISFSMNNQSIISPDLMSKMMPHVLIYKEALFTHNVLYLFGFIGVNILAFIIGVTLISLLYKPINSLPQKTADGTYRKESSGNYSYNKALFMKEFKMVTSKPNLFVNSIIGSIMFPLSCIIMFVIAFNKTSEIPYTMTYMIPFFGLLMNSAMNITSSLFSLEGKNFELLLSYPIKPMDVIKAKMKVGYIIPGVINILSSTIMVVVLSIKGLSIDWSFIVLLYLSPQLAIIYSTITGALCNLRWPKLDFETDVQVIKNSSSAGFSILFCMVPAMVVGGIMFIFSIFSNVAALLALLISYSIMILIVSLIMKKKGEKLFLKMINR